LELREPYVPKFVIVNPILPTFVYFCSTSTSVLSKPPGPSSEKADTKGIIVSRIRIFLEDINTSNEYHSEVIDEVYIKSKKYKVIPMKNKNNF
jgi:hypothetical protein